MRALSLACSLSTACLLRACVRACVRACRQTNLSKVLAMYEKDNDTAYFDRYGRLGRGSQKACMVRER